MIKAPVRARFAFSKRRLDVNYFLSPGVRAEERLVLLKAAGVLTRTVGGPGGLGRVVPTTRSKRVYAAPGESAVPYLRPYDVFDYLPQAADLLSRTGNPGVTALQPEPGCLLQTCSGRNLGPLTYADRYLARFAVSDDMLRVYIEDEELRLYTLAFLSTPTGQSLLARSKTGAVIDHLSAKDLSRVEVPVFESEVVRGVADAMRRAVALREAARVIIAEQIAEYEAEQPNLTRSQPLKAGWTQSASSLTGRVDAAFYDPLVRQVSHDLVSAGGVRCHEVATVFIPGRYTRYYVSADYGRPIVSGRQLLQYKPINLRYIAPRSFDYAEYELHYGMLAFGAEGRAEERIGFPALITADRATWLANNHVMRVSPNQGVNPGWLFLAFAAWQAQVQVKARACGSVVDTVYPSDLEDVVLPPMDERRGSIALQAWHDFASASALESSAVADVERLLHERAPLNA